jgi:hypothetical protein
MTVATYSIFLGHHREDVLPLAHQPRHRKSRLDEVVELRHAPPLVLVPHEISQTKVILLQIALSRPGILRAGWPRGEPAARNDMSVLVAV